LFVNFKEIYESGEKYCTILSGNSIYCAHENSPLFYFYFFAQQPPVGQGLLTHEVSRSHTTTHHTVYEMGSAVSNNLALSFFGNFKKKVHTWIAKAYNHYECPQL
jgi:hypothetical protein